MRRTPIAAIVLAGLLATGCGASSSASSTTSTTTSAAKVTAREWLTATAEHWNKQLNTDQNSVDAAAGASSGTSSSTYFSHLTTACTKLRDHAEQAMGDQKAPTASLQTAWNAMLSATVTYASKCLQLAHSHSSSDATTWQNTLTSMNTANDTFNRVADAAANVSGNSSTTTTRPT
jgi:hypothetical protein